jgi:tRNA A37 threonylcarbamoyladenosine dehydratase
MSFYADRFGGLSRIYGDSYLSKAQNAHVCVIGIGGVGTWVVESLARSGIGKLTLVDLDDVCITNTNRQLHAFEGQVGKLKVDAMAERAKQINPDITVETFAEFFTQESAERILATSFHFVVDAIDSIPDKCTLIAECQKRNIPFVISGAAGGKTDPTKIAIDDLARTQADNLLKSLKRALKKHRSIEPHTNGEYAIPCVFSREPAVMPWDVCSATPKPQAGGVRIDCASGFGAASFTTGAFGLALASYVVSKIAQSS